MPPFGHATQLRVFVDSDLLQYDEVWAAAGTWNDNFGAAPPISSQFEELPTIKALNALTLDVSNLGNN